MKISVLDSNTLDLPAEEWAPVRALGDLALHGLTPSDAEATASALKDAEIALTNKAPITRGVLELSPQLKLISVLATGFNVIDIEAAAEKGVVVCNAPAYSASSVAQHTLALALELCNQCGLHTQSVMSGEWAASKTFAYWKQAPVELEGLKFGIVGFGDIGQRVGALAHAFGAHILGASRSRKKTPEWKPFDWAEIDEIFETADIVSLHCPQTPETTGLVSKERLSRMKNSARLINTGRGGLVDEAALADALNSGMIAGAALDVVSKEPMTEDNPLLGAKNLIITPHLAWASLPSRQRLIRITADNIEAYQKGAPINRVDQ